ncbi:MAG: hypothetical protein QW273_03235 [Candidatus Pacearchaeota archaeon]
MEKRKKILLILLLLLAFFNLVFLIISIFSFSFVPVSGRTSLGGGIILSIGEKKVFIHSPENRTYNFEVSNDSYYFPLYNIPLNVSSNFEVKNWSYILFQKTPRNYVNSFNGGYFTPNLSDFRAYRWNNTLTVYAEDKRGEKYFKDVSFFVEVPNTAPLILEPFNTSLFGCENEIFSYSFNATDRDEDDLNAIVSPSEIFFGSVKSIPNQTTVTLEVTSRILSKAIIGGNNFGNKTYPLVVYAVDPSNLLDYKNLNVTILEINNPPRINPIGTRTVWTKGENSTLFEKVYAEDLEDGNSDIGNLSFYLEFLNSPQIFNISENGTIYFQPNETYLEEDGSSKIYYVKVCVKDNGIKNPYPNLNNLCNNNGSSLSVCEYLFLVVTQENRPPIIKSYYPKNLSLEIFGTQELFFNASAYDPDGNLLDLYWYVDNFSKKVDYYVNVSNFTFTFGCNVKGNHKLKLIATDGNLSDSIEWNISVKEVPCEKISLGGGGGGGCSPKWVCEDWKICQNLERTAKKGEILGEIYRNIKEKCNIKNLNDSVCGFQTRQCHDLNNCSSMFGMPPQIQDCYFKEEPNCFDGILNCHDGSCEIGIDCGGPCKPCPSCSDGIKNQGEEGIDCGGPCPLPCYKEQKPKTEVEEKETPLYYYLIIGILFILCLILLVKIIRMLKFKKELEEFEED